MRIRKEDEKNENDKNKGIEWGWEKRWKSWREGIRMKEFEKEWGWEKKMIN